MLHAFRGRLPAPPSPVDVRPRLVREARRLLANPDLAATEVRRDIESALAETNAPGPVLRTLDHLGSLIEESPGAPRLVQCELVASGHALVAWQSTGRRSSVATGDVFTAGVAFLWQPDGGYPELTVAPRLVRQVCTNGQVLPEARELGSETWSWSKRLGERGDLERTVAASLSGRVVERATHVLRRARQVPAGRAPTQPGGASRALYTGDLWRWVMRVFERRGDPSRYGLLNALTEVARDAPEARTQMRLEQDAGLLIARFATGLEHPPAGALDSASP